MSVVSYLISRRIGSSRKRPGRLAVEHMHNRDSRQSVTRDANHFIVSATQRSVLRHFHLRGDIPAELVEVVLPLMAG